MQRRDLLKSGLAAAVGGWSGAARALAEQSDETPNSAIPPKPIHDRICLFTDHVDDSGFSYRDVAKMFRQLGVAGPDLTVRGGGLVPPERVSEELPKAAAAFRDEGLSIPMLTTSITDAADPVARATLKAMSEIGIGYYKLGYYHYHDLAGWESELKQTQQAVAGLVEIGKPLGVVGGIHNHAGPTVGGVLWDLSRLLEPLDANWIGAYFDPAHATVEGGNYGWKLNFQVLARQLKMIALKDFVWERTNGQWRVRWCPLGEGMVRWPDFFALLRGVRFAGPISLHIEYDVGGNTRAERFDNSLAAAGRDLEFLKARLEEAYSAPDE